MLISFEGLDFSGKTTQIKLLVKRLTSENRQVLLVREPGGTSISEKIRGILLDKNHLEITQEAELLLFSAARTQLVDQIIIPALKEGKIVICDRYYDSTTAYQGYGRGLDLNAVKIINYFATSGNVPDLTFFIDIPIEEIERRIRTRNEIADRMESSGIEFFKKVRNGYLEIAKNEPERFIVIDGLKKIETIHNEICGIVYEKL